jgi:hypothetical protein
MPVNGRSWGFNVSEGDLNLRYMIDIVMTIELSLAVSAVGSSKAR